MTALALWPDGIVASSILLVFLIGVVVWRGIRVHVTVKKEDTDE